MSRKCHLNRWKALFEWLKDDPSLCRWSNENHNLHTIKRLTKRLMNRVFVTLLPSADYGVSYKEHFFKFSYFWSLMSYLELNKLGLPNRKPQSTLIHQLKTYAISICLETFTFSSTSFGSSTVSTPCSTLAEIASFFTSSGRISVCSYFE